MNDIVTWTFKRAALIQGNQAMNFFHFPLVNREG